MTPEQISVILQSVHYPGEVDAGPGRDEVLAAFGESDGVALGRRLLLEATSDRTADNVELALIVVATFGWSLDELDLLLGLALSDWHMMHESIASLLGSMGSSRAVPVLESLVNWIPGYLEFDDSRALAVKAIYALASIGGDAAVEALKRVNRLDDDVLSGAAQKLLQSGGSGGRKL